jgi:hypothetical protein
MVYYSKHKTYKFETLHTILNMSKQYSRIVELKLRLLEEPYEKTFVVPYVENKQNKNNVINGLLVSYIPLLNVTNTSIIPLFIVIRLTLISSLIVSDMGCGSPHIFIFIPSV